MPFLIAVNIALYAQLWGSISSVGQIMSGVRSHGAFMLYFFSMLCGSVATLNGVGLLPLEALGFGRQASVTVPAFALFGVLTAVIGGWKIYQAFHAEPAVLRGWRFGMKVWLLVSGLYIFGTTLDHWWFFRDPDRVGVAAHGALGADDVPCDASMVLMRIESDAAVYRCPSMFVFDGLLSSAPFVPWPNYDQGKSVKLKLAVEQLQRDAVNYQLDSHENGRPPR